MQLQDSLSMSSAMNLKGQHRILPQYLLSIVPKAVLGCLTSPLFYAEDSRRQCCFVKAITLHRLGLGIQRLSNEVAIPTIID